jgi:hypothetical protein
MPVIEPNSPEAKKLADRVRSTYFFVAALNFVIIAVIAINVWPQSTSNAADAPAKTTPASTDPAKPDSTDPDPEKPDATKPGPAKPAKPVVVATTPEQKAAIAEMEKLNEQVLASYAAGDAVAFAKDFSPTAVPKPDAHFFKKVVVGLYQDEFGEITAKKFTGETSANTDYGMLVYECTCKKRKAKLSVNFRREGPTLKIVQWRMEKM